MPLYLRDRARAVPEAAGGRRPRPRLRDQPQLPERGHLDPAQPRVHDARVLSGVRGLQRPDGAHRGALRAPRPDGPRAARRSSYQGETIELAPPWLRLPFFSALSRAVGVTVTPGDRRRRRSGRPPRCARRRCAGDAAQATPSRTWARTRATGRALEGDLRHARRADADPAHLRHRFPDRAVAAVQAQARATRASSTASSSSSAGGSSPTPTPS